jgi:hypothetical protein
MKRGRNQRRRQGGMNVNRALDSNGPEVRIRGTASQIYEKYQALARDASSSGDRVKAENYLQHAEHYFRVIRAMQPAQAPQSEQGGEGDFEGEQPVVGDYQERRPYQENGHGGDMDEAGESSGQSAEQPRDGGRSDEPQRAAGGEQGRDHHRDGDDRRYGRRRRRPHRGDRRDAQQGGAEAAESDEGETAGADEVPA